MTKYLGIGAAFIAAAALGIAFGVTRAREPDQGAMASQQADRKTQESMAALPPETRHAIDDALSKAKERPIRPRIMSLDEKALKAIPLEDLDASLMDYVDDRLGGKLGSPVAFASLPRGLQVFFLSGIAGSEVMNGGFNQFFWNSSADYASLVPAALRELNADEAASVFERAQVVASSEDAMRAKFKAMASRQAFSDSYKETLLTPFDAPFSKLAEGFPALRAKYFQAHPELFTS